MSQLPKQLSISIPASFHAHIDICSFPFPSLQFLFMRPVRVQWITSFHWPDGNHFTSPTPYFSLGATKLSTSPVITQSTWRGTELHPFNSHFMHNVKLYMVTFSFSIPCINIQWFSVLPPKKLHSFVVWKEVKKIDLSSLHLFYCSLHTKIYLDADRFNKKPSLTQIFVQHSSGPLPHVVWGNTKHLYNTTQRQI